MSTLEINGSAQPVAAGAWRLAVAAAAVVRRDMEKGVVKGSGASGPRDVRVKIDQAVLTKLLFFMAENATSKRRRREAMRTGKAAAGFSLEPVDGPNSFSAYFRKFVVLNEGRFWDRSVRSTRQLSNSELRRRMVGGARADAKPDAGEDIC